jgi:ferredoxin
MIFSRQKPLDEILEILSEYEKVCVIGCSECAAMCMTGGEPEIAAMKTALEDAGKVVTDAFVPAGGLCNMAAFKTALKDHKEGIEQADCLLTFGCGTGAQSVSMVSRKLTVSGNDTVCISVEAPFKEFLDRCAACGQCELGWTAGLCPMTTCSKSLLNGPCGGMEAGKCEVDRNRDCGWVLIYKRLEELGLLEQLEQVRFKDYSKQNRPRDFQLDG